MINDDTCSTRWMVDDDWLFQVRDPASSLSATTAAEPECRKEDRRTSCVIQRLVYGKRNRHTDELLSSIFTVPAIQWTEVNRRGGVLETTLEVLVLRDIHFVMVTYRLFERAFPFHPVFFCPFFISIIIVQVISFSPQRTLVAICSALLPSRARERETERKRGQNKVTMSDGYGIAYSFLLSSLESSTSFIVIVHWQ